MYLRIKGELYEVDENRITVGEARVLKTNSGMGAYQLRDGLLRGDPDVMIFMMWLAMTRAGEKRVTWSGFDDYDLIEDVELFADPDESGDESDDPPDDDAAEQGRADPTSPGGTTPTAGSSNTSRRSRSTSGSTRAKSKS